MFTSDMILNQRYQLIRSLGQAASRQTWLATDQQHQDSVVVKLLLFGGAMEWQDLKLFEREAQVLQQLNHANVPEYRDHFSSSEPPSWFALVHTYIPGQSLKDWVDQGRRFSELELRQIASQVLEILIYLHGLTPRILHRDIKPSNLIWGEDGRVYLVDFGAVQAQASTHTKTFTVVGTYGYTPIEQYGGHAVPASDLYALGATLVHLATGRAPSELPQREMRLQFRDQVDLDPRFVRWLEQLTEPVLDQRIPTAKRALEQLHLTTGISLQPFRSSASINREQPSIERTPQILRLTLPGLSITPSGLSYVFLNPIVWIYTALILATLVFGVRPLMGFWALLAAPLVFASYFSLTKFLDVTVTLTGLELQMSYQLLDWILFTRSLPVSEIDEIEAVPAADVEENRRYKLTIRTQRGRYSLGNRYWEQEQIQKIQQQLTEWLAEKHRSDLGTGETQPGEVGSELREGRGR